MVTIDAIVKACLEHYDALPKSGKPTSDEWTVISAVVGIFKENESRVLSMGTGSKCLGQSSMSFKGDVLNDSHAEVLARRSFLKYLYLELIKLNETNSSDVFYHENDSVLAHLKPSVKFYFVTNMVPCGDASIMPKDDSELDEESLYGKRLKMSLEINFKDEKEAKDIHRTGAKCLPNSSIQDPHLPGTHYHNTGAVRTKPGRGDPTLSLSCSDKIAKWNAVGWQGALLSLFIKKPIFVDAIICGGGVPFCLESFDRAINKRIDKCPAVSIKQSTIILKSIRGKGKKPCPSSLIWCSSSIKGVEVSTNGRKHGVTKKNLNKSISRVSVCKKELFHLFVKVVSTLKNSDSFIQALLSNSSAKSLQDISYGELKSVAAEYQKNWKIVKEKYFNVWSSKPPDLENFTVVEN